MLDALVYFFVSPRFLFYKIALINSKIELYSKN